MADTFLELTDTPASYSGADGDVVRVNGTPDGLEFTSVGTFNALLSFILLSDTPASYSGLAGKGVRINSGANALEFVSFFANGGDAGGAYRSLGNTDNYPLGIITNNTTQMRIDNTGDVNVLTGSLMLNLNNEAIVGSTVASGPVRMLYLHSSDYTMLNSHSSTGIRFCIGGTEKIRITSAGRLGIGESSPDSLLHVGGKITADYSGSSALILAGQGGYDDIGLTRQSNSHCLYFDQYIDSTWQGIASLVRDTDGTDHVVFALDPDADLTFSEIYSYSTSYLKIGSAGDIRLIADDYIVLASNKGTSGNPASPVEGQLVINTADDNIKIYVDGDWRTWLTW